MVIKRPNPLDAVLLTGAQSVGGVKTFTRTPVLRMEIKKRYYLKFKRYKQTDKL